MEERKAPWMTELETLTFKSKIERIVDSNNGGLPHLIKCSRILQTNSNIKKMRFTSRQVIIRRSQFRRIDLLINIIKSFGCFFALFCFEFLDHFLGFKWIQGLVSFILHWKLSHSLSFSSQLCCVSEHLRKRHVSCDWEKLSTAFCLRDRALSFNECPHYTRLILSRHLYRHTHYWFQDQWISTEKCFLKCIASSCHKRHGTWVDHVSLPILKHKSHGYYRVASIWSFFSLFVKCLLNRRNVLSWNIHAFCFVNEFTTTIWIFCLGNWLNIADNLSVLTGSSSLLFMQIIEISFTRYSLSVIDSGVAYFNSNSVLSSHALCINL